MKWIKLSTATFSDEVVAIIEAHPNGSDILIVWFKILCLLGAAETDGVLVLKNDTKNIPYTDEMLSHVIHMELPRVREAMQVLTQFGLVEQVDGTYVVPTWNEYQGSEKLDREREQNRARQRRHRENQRKMLPDRPAGETMCNVTDNVTGSVTDNAMSREQTKTKTEDKEKDQDICASDDAPKRTRFVPPTVDEVRAYEAEKGYTFDAEAFVAYYTSNGWKVGRNAMKSWKAACRTWQSRERSPGCIVGDAPDLMREGW